MNKKNEEFKKTNITWKLKKKSLRIIQVGADESKLQINLKYSKKNEIPGKEGEEM